MVFMRGHRSSYERWGNAGAKGWDFDDLLPFFRRTETAAGRDPALRGTDGPLTVGPAAQPNPVIAACLDAAEEAGYRRSDDISGGLEEGFGWTDLNIVAGRKRPAGQRQPGCRSGGRPAVSDRPSRCPRHGERPEDRTEDRAGKGPGAVARRRSAARSRRGH
jgi:choline dehydrogenase-like flavoprotein